MELDQKLLDILACPQCKESLSLTQDNTGLICETCELRYPIKDGIPVMLSEEAQKINV
ncbi:Trm112 family protein [bacterium]|nr:Trm112 family protein [bacterium]